MERFRTLAEHRCDAPLVSARAQDASSGAEVLVRTLDPAVQASAVAGKLFREEIAAAAALPAGHGLLLGPVAWSDGEQPFLARPFARGGALEAQLEGARWSAEQIVAWISWLARALEALHALGLAHGDPSPRNILLLEEGGDPRLADPASSRRRFASGGARSEPDTAASDHAAAVRLLDRLLESVTSRDDEATLQSELVRLRYCNLTAKEKLDAARRLDETHPEAPRCSGGAPAAPSVSAFLRVVLSAGPFADRDAHEQARRWAVTFLRGSAEDVRAANDGAHIAFEVEWPEPCRGLADRMRSLGVPVRVACRVRGRLP